MWRACVLQRLRFETVRLRFLFFFGVKGLHGSLILTAVLGEIGVGLLKRKGTVVIGDKSILRLDAITEDVEDKMLLRI